MKAARSIFLSWLPLAGATAGILLICHAAVQQNYRQSLNDPQIQMAEDAAHSLASGTAIAQIVSPGAVGAVDIAASLASWIAIYDGNGMPLVSDAVLGGKLPQLPVGALDAARDGLPLIVGHHLTTGILGNENRVSWQPATGVRQAMVVVYVPQTNQFAVVGRNMREVEDRIGSLGEIFFLGWLALMIATLFAKILEWYFA